VTSLVLFAVSASASPLGSEKRKIGAIRFVPSGPEPYIGAIVDLEDDVCMNAQMRGVPVQVIFERTKECLTLPAFVRIQ
jgi:hypothetical protein